MLFNVTFEMDEMPESCYYCDFSTTAYSHSTDGKILCLLLKSVSISLEDSDSFRSPLCPLMPVDEVGLTEEERWHSRYEIRRKQNE